MAGPLIVNQIEHLETDVFGLRLDRQFDLIYADPPYANCRFKYARQNNSRQWGKDKRADFVRELIAVMDWHRSDEGVCAMSMATPELRLMPLFPTTARVFAWCKPHAPMRPGVWPCYAWEPVIAWGKFPDREQQKTGKTPMDWVSMAPAVPDGSHETAKPQAFGDWVCNLTLGPRQGNALELFAGTCPISTAAIARGCKATAVDVERYRVQNRLAIEIPA